MKRSTVIAVDLSVTRPQRCENPALPYRRTTPQLFTKQHRTEIPISSRQRACLRPYVPAYHARMPPTKRLLVALGAVLLLVSAGVTLRALQQTQNTPPAPNSEIRRVDRFTNRNVLVPQPIDTPATPADLRVTSEVGALRADWADAGASGYEVTWRHGGELDHTMLTIQPEVRLGGLRAGVSYSIEVRAVDAYGKRSNPAEATGTPAAAPDNAWKTPLTGLFDDFSDVATLTRRWHLAGYQGCVDAAGGAGGLVIGLECGADEAVLRARSRIELGSNGELGRIAVVTDAAGPGGRLTVDLSPGPVDRVGPTLPPGAVQIVVDDQGAQVLAADDVPRVPGAHPAVTVARGIGVPHRFEVVLRSDGITVLQDGQEIGFGGVVPSWRSAYVLYGLQGPAGLKSRVFVDAAGFSGPPSPAQSVGEVSLVPATIRVLGPTDLAPGIGISRKPLIGAASARYVATVRADSADLDPGGLSVQLGDARYPVVQADPGPVPSGSVTTVYADLPAVLLGPSGPDQLSPYVLRSDRGQATIVESYLEIHSTGAPPPFSSPALAAAPPVSQPPLVQVDSSQDSGRFVLDVTLDGRYNSEVTGIAGFEVWVDGQQMVGQPTDAGGPGLGGRYTVVFSAGALRPGKHTVDVREYPVDSSLAAASTLKDVTVT
ncbi:fibronectin type III domain-containing protein [Kutzneria sp. NPDC052558]|uniref:fibronectin type III domain-containing protein n=1 Tax=Kutzneria sp. NPDC052558 TaxID=3364121 RepID=UPI0037CBA46B